MRGTDPGSGVGHPFALDVVGHGAVRPQPGERNHKLDLPVAVMTRAGMHPAASEPLPQVVLWSARQRMCPSRRP